MGRIQCECTNNELEKASEGPYADSLRYAIRRFYKGRTVGVRCLDDTQLCMWSRQQVKAYECEVELLAFVRTGARLLDRKTERLLEEQVSKYNG